MQNSAKELLGLSDDSWQKVVDKMDSTMAGTERCRKVIHIGEDKIGEVAVVVPNIAAGPPITFGPDIIISPVHIYVDSTIDDSHIKRDADIIQLIATAAAQLGEYEDVEIIQGGPLPPARGAVPVTPGRNPRNPALVRTSVWRSAVRQATVIGAAGPAPTGNQVLTSINNAIAALAAHPGNYGFLVSTNIMAILNQPLIAGGTPLIHDVEERIGSNSIASTNALLNTNTGGDICGILFRVDPPALEIVNTMKPTLIGLGRAGGQTTLRIEEEIAVRILDPAAIQLIAY